MDPTVEAAWIAASVGGLGIVSTAVVAIAGVRAAGRVADKTIRGGITSTSLFLDAARADRVWEAQATAYADAVKLLRHRLLTRSEMTRPIRYDAQTEQQIEEWLASIKLPEWPDTEARLHTFATQVVLDAMKSANQADGEAVSAFEHYKYMAGQATRASQAGGFPGPAGDEVIIARNNAMAAAKTASEKDNALIAAIRADLHQRPSRSLLPQEPAPTAEPWRELLDYRHGER